MKRVLLAVLLTLQVSICHARDSTTPILGDSVVFEEVGGIIAVEAEHFFKQQQSETRAWHLTTAASQPEVAPDGDPNHVAGASGGAYLEALPDTRRTHDDKLVAGENFANTAGTMAVLSYKVWVNNPGRYYVWARVYSTGTEDNGLHVGIDGQWPESGQRMQWTAKNKWFWDSKQRTQQVHTGVPHQLYLDIDKPGDHIITFSMREDGFEFDKWLMTRDRDFSRPEDVGPPSRLKRGELPEPFEFVALTEDTAAPNPKPLVQPRGKNGDGSARVTGERKQWHKVTLTLDGPFAHELDAQPNTFTDYRMTVRFAHESGVPAYDVPGYFAADGDAANSSSESGTKWRAHLSPDKVGKWSYRVSFAKGAGAALGENDKSSPLPPYDGQTGEFTVAASDKTGRDLRGKGRLQYVGRHYLRFAGNGEYFLKAGADAPETLLGYADFDGTVARKAKVPLKTWAPHIRDWQEGDPTWKENKGKGLIGAVNYLSGKGCNAFSFLTYNAGGDGDNVWPFASRDDKLHYDCSKLDQWGIVFEHGTRRGMYLHFKLQETEMDDNRRGKGKGGGVPESLDGGALGRERKLYCRELVARFAHNLALNWNLGEENTQSTDEQRAMSAYLRELDPYDHPIVVHTFPEQQEAVYRPLLGDGSVLVGASLQNSNIKDTHSQTDKWVRESAAAGKPWVVAFDESGSAAHGQPPDLGYKGFDGKDRTGKHIYTQHEVRRQTLWGTLMAGGAGVEYYFGYQFVENDLVCEDWRSRDQSWDDCRIAIDFFADNKIPFWEMTNADELVGNKQHDNSRYCFAKPDEVYLVYLPDGGSTEIDLANRSGGYSVEWFNPRRGGELSSGNIETIRAGKRVSVGQPPRDVKEDWLLVLRRQP